MPPPAEILEMGRSGPDAPRGTGHRRPASSWLPLACALVVGVLIGALGVYWWDYRQERLRADRQIDVRIALGADGGISEQNSLRVVVATNLVVLNAGRKPLVLEGFEIDGPGALLVTNTAGWPSTQLPQPLPPGQPVMNRIGLASECSVRARPLPTITLQLRDGEGRRIRRSVWIPDLESLWGQTLAPPACAELISP